MLKILKWIVLACITGIVSIAFGSTIILWIAKYTDKPVLFLTAGIFVFICTFVVLIRTILFFSRDKHSCNIRVYKNTAYIIGSFLIMIFTLTLIVPLSNQQQIPISMKEQRFWQLPSGEKIAYVLLTKQNNISKSPIIFLHGGPGVPDMAGDAEYFGQLTSEGHDVYVYDEVGSGLSSRLKNPKDYTIQRDVNNLESIRDIIGSERIILIGHSYGGEIAANYLASYSSHVDKAVFISPGSINPNDTSGANLTGRLTYKEKIPLFKKLLYPRILMTYGLLQINPMAARNFAGDNEMDYQFDLVYEYTQPSLHSRSKPLGPKLSGLGFYANQTPQSTAAKPKLDIRNSLSNLNTEALILKGSSDYLSWSSAVDYKKALRNSTLVYLDDAGHNIYQDRPEDVLNLIRAFLRSESLPIDSYKGIEPPADYEGMH